MGITEKGFVEIESKQGESLTRAGIRDGGRRMDSGPKSGVYRTWRPWE
jgi:hypothetical protein